MVEKQWLNRGGTMRVDDGGVLLDDVVLADGDAALLRDDFAARMEHGALAYVYVALQRAIFRHDGPR